MLINDSTGTNHLFHELPLIPASLSPSVDTIPPKGVLSATIKGFWRALQKAATSSAYGIWHLSASWQAYGWVKMLTPHQSTTSSPGYQLLMGRPSRGAWGGEEWRRVDRAHSRRV